MTPSYAQYVDADGQRWNFWQSRLSTYQAASDFIRYKALMRMIPKDASRVLDVGCGDGYLDYLISLQGKSAISLDLSYSRLSKARTGQQANFSAVQADCTALPLAAGSCDAVVYSEILEHLPDPAAAMREGARVLRPGGTLIVSVPHAQDASDIVCPNCLKQFNGAGHLQHFQPEEMRQLISTSGLTVTRLFTAANALSRYTLRRMEKLAPVILAVDAVFTRVAPGDNLHLFAVARKPESARG